jgi:uncharacterized LabA/DUF88 family protein
MARNGLVIHIDSQNIYRHDPGFRLNYQRLAEVVAGGRHVAAAIYYRNMPARVVRDSRRGEPLTQEGIFLKGLRDSGFTTVFPNIVFGTQPEGNDIDLAIAENLVSWARTGRPQALVSGDRDFRTPVLLARRMGCWVEVAAFTGDLSEDLARIASRTVILDRHLPLLGYQPRTPAKELEPAGSGWLSA